MKAKAVPNPRDQSPVIPIWKSELVFAKRKQECQHMSLSKHMTHWLRHRENAHDDDGAVPWRTVMDFLLREEHARNWSYQDWERALSLALRINRGWIQGHNIMDNGLWTGGIGSR